MRLFRSKKTKRTVFQVAGRYQDITLGEWCDYHVAPTETAKIAAIFQITLDQAQAISKEKGRKALALFERALEEERQVFKQKVEVGGKELRIIPDLTNITYGEHADLVENCKREHVFKNLPKVLAILYRPTTKVLGNKYEVEAYDSDIHLSPESIQRIRQMPLLYANGALAFFLTISNELNANLQLSLIREMRTTMDQI